jgi:transposase
LAAFSTAWAIGYAASSKRVLKKIPETDAIFAHVHATRERTAAEPDTLRVSIDTKANVKVGDFCRGGQSRSLEPVKAVDHDMSADAVLVPFGILELNRGSMLIHQPWLLFGHSKQTSDFLADGLERWWSERKSVHAGVKKLHIELDNGPEISSSRTQFMKRLVEFADRHRIEIELVYLPPYHSKYNPIERVWGVLEQHWNATLLKTVSEVLSWAGTMTWRGRKPIVGECQMVYQRGVRVLKRAYRAIAERLQRSATLPKWSRKILPQ